jgi:two-component system, sporulation sensor kinase A
MPDNYSAEQAASYNYSDHFFHSVKKLAEEFLAEIAREHREAKEFIDRAQEAIGSTIERSNRIIQLIHHFRAQSCPAEIKVENAATLIRDCTFQVLRAMQYEFPMERITILKILPHDLEPVPMAREHLETLLFQLIYHAREALKNCAGIITIEACEKTYLSSENRSKSRFTLRISDSGFGIPESQLEHIFDPMAALLNAKAAMGLCLVKKIVDHYRGTIQVETSARGTSFYLEFPR